jgi:5'-3' exonuclease
MISNLMAQIGNHHNAEIDENLLRHMVLNSIRANKKQFSHEYGELIVACDSRNSWRRDIFPYYKANRRKNREESELNWTMIFETLGRIRDELQEFFPYRVIQIEGAEADDVIATLVKEYHSEGILILSGDKDFSQLQQYARIKQYDPTRKKYIVCDNPKSFLKEHIIRGDSGDGVPNFLSEDNTFVLGVRQKSISSKKLVEWLAQEPESFCDEYMMRNFKRNQTLVDFDYIPDSIEVDVVKAYNEQANKGRSKLFNYFIKYKLKNLLTDINDF